MRGFLGRFSQTPAQSGLSCGDGELGTALRRVTHADTVAAPQALREAARLAAESEEALAVALRHIEENVIAPPAEWRRVHGALQLLERLLRPEDGGGHDDQLIGRIWYETKMQGKLASLSEFDHNGDSRVASLVRRMAANCQSAAEKTILVDCDVLSDEDHHSSRPESVRSAEGGGTAAHHAQEVCAGGGSSSSSSCAAGTSASKVTSSVIGKPAVATTDTFDASGGDATNSDRKGGDWTGGMRKPSSDPTAPRLEAAHRGSLRNAASALDALKDPETKVGISERERLAAENAATPKETLPRRCCGCFWRRFAPEPPEAPPDKMDTPCGSDGSNASEVAKLLGGGGDKQRGH